MVKRKVSPQEKIQIVLLVQNGKRSINSLANEYNLDYTTIHAWIRNYNSMGTVSFGHSQWTKRTQSEKEAAVLSYISGEGSLRDVCFKYKIKSTSMLRKWIKKYNSHEKLKAFGKGACKIMTKGRKSTFDERVEIVQFCIANAHDYNETAKKYNVSYQQARSYTVKYETHGVEGLKDNRGKKKDFNDMTELEKLRAENRILRAEKKQAEMEASFLKKLAEIERRRGLI
ncbi:transposase [Acidaminococcus provencensis]|uniref:transposase n=1 Tax=Acidaminococcus provencensis TaxID=2058289 RepID=UPI0022E2A199|nr:transposase [Acidaminococcus provencensis]